uniref:Uncharacterized mitochondrial protein AtMg00810-like n=1 Tax=Tanacetum cinerariifolium TaxID=118510 RepID=A0A6L2JY12_TANCI|nr:uncharacterized mitochondrial protein AtMg00810-like [Tanacetum cinerariifolium]
MGELTFFLGLQVKQKPDGIFISQDKYVAEILKKFGLTDGKSASTPIDTEKPLLKDPNGKDVDVHTYRSMIGSLMYLTSSRPDIMFSICACARFQVTPKASHLHAVKGIFRYLKGKPHLGLWYLKDSPFNLMAYSDSDYAGASLDRKSTTRGCQFLSCRLISWKCKKHTVVATSSTEAEYVSISGEGILELEDPQELLGSRYEKPSTKLTFYKAFFSAQWKFLIHTILQCISAKRTAWNEFSSSMASAIICLATGRKFIFSKYIFDSLVRNVDSSSKFYMYPRFLQLMLSAQVGDLSSHTTKYTSPALIQKVFANTRRVRKGFFGVDTPLFKGMLVPQQIADDVVDVVADEVADDVVAEDFAEPTPPSPTPTTTPPPPQQEVTSTPPPSPHQSLIAPPLSPPSLQQPLHNAAIFMDLLNTLLETCTSLIRKVEALEQDKIAQALEITKLKQRRMHPNMGIIELIDADEDVILEEADAAKDDEVTKDADDDDPEPAKIIEVIKVVTTTKLITEVVIAAATTDGSTITAALSATRRRKRVVIRDPKETATPSTIVHSEIKSKDKGKGILVKEPKPLKKQAQIEQDKSYAREGMSYDDIRPIFEKYFNSNVAFLEKSVKELEEKASMALKRKSKSSEEKSAKKQKLDEEEKELKKHLQIVPNDKDDVYTEATPLALKEVDVSKDAKVEKNADVQGRQEESQAKVYHIDLEHADKVLSMHDDEPEPAELQEYIFDSLMRNVDSSSKFYMYSRFLQLMIRAQVGDLSSNTTKYSSPALTQKVFTNIRRVGKGFFGVETPLFERILVQQQAAIDVDDVVADSVPIDDVAIDDVPAADAEPTPPSPPPITTPPLLQELPFTS